jgi:hypothetical protein
VNVEALHRPLSIDAIRHGGVYTLSLEPLPQTNLFLKVGCIDDVFVKMPSQKGLDDYRRDVRRAQRTSADIRALEESERFEALDWTLQRFPEFSQLGTADREVVHYLAVHRIQYERLRTDVAVNVPAARFAVLRSGRLIRKLQPVFFQERVEGTTLWEMFDFSVLEVTRRWWPFLPTISTQLKRLLDSDLLPHIDWNIQNFVFRETDQRLFYVDMKPTIFVTTQSNEHNLNGIREYFVE